MKPRRQSNFSTARFRPMHALLDQVEQRHAVALVALRDRDDEAQVGVDHPLLGRAVAALHALCERDLVGCGQQRVPADLVQEQLQRVAGGRGEIRGRDGLDRCGDRLFALGDDDAARLELLAQLRDLLLGEVVLLREPRRARSPRPRRDPRRRRRRQSIRVQRSCSAKLLSLRAACREPAAPLETFDPAAARCAPLAARIGRVAVRANVDGRLGARRTQLQRASARGAADGRARQFRVYRFLQRRLLPSVLQGGRGGDRRRSTTCKEENVLRTQGIPPQG